MPSCRRELMINMPSSSVMPSNMRNWNWGFRQMTWFLNWRIMPWVISTPPRRELCRIRKRSSMLIWPGFISGTARLRPANLTFSPPKELPPQWFILLNHCGRTRFWCPGTTLPLSPPSFLPTWKSRCSTIISSVRFTSPGMKKKGGTCRNRKSINSRIRRSRLCSWSTRWIPARYRCRKKRSAGLPRSLKNQKRRMIVLLVTVQPNPE